MHKISVQQIRENELTDFVNNLLTNISGVDSVSGISGIYADYTSGIITIGYTGVSFSVPLLTGFLATGDYQLNNSLIASNGGNLLDSEKLAEFNSYGQLDYRTTIIPDLNHDIDKRIWGLTPSTGNKQIFSVSNHATATYVRNTGCWAYGIDLTPISVWNSQGVNQRGGILISPRHVLMADHFAITGGSIMRWVDNNNNVISSRLSGSIQVGSTDLRIGVLDGDITGNISYAKVLPNGFTGYFNTSGIPLLFTDQEEKVLVGESLNDFNSNIDIIQSSNIYRSGFYELPIGGDSGDPICVVIGNELVVLSTFFTDIQGPYVSNYYTNVNASINTLGNSNGYQLTPISQNYFPINWNQISNIPNPYFDPPVLSDVVYTTGDQNIGGFKKFTDNISAGNIADLQLLQGNDLKINFSQGWFLNNSDDILMILDSYQLLNLGGITLNWNLRQLSGNWSTNTTPTQSGNLINKGYLDNILATGGGGSSVQKETINFYPNYSITGLNIQEYFITNNLTLTGAKIGCFSSGLGPAHLSSGASGSLVFGTLTGQIYQRTINNTKISLFGFSFNSGQLYSGFSVPNIVVSGSNRIGFDLYSGLSGLEGLCISFNGYYS